MRLEDFHYDLPEALIAQHPLPERSASRLLCMDRRRGDLADRFFTDLPGLLRPGDLAVFNDTRVIAARLLGRKSTGGRIEVLLEAVLDADLALARLGSSKRLAADGTVELADGVTARCEGFEGDLARLRFSHPLEEVVGSQGHVPLPPYIRRPDDDRDRERYQTVYAAAPGAIAAPTAGLHFDDGVLAELDRRGIGTGFVTLHVGSGTFAPVRAEDPREHRIHSERLEVSPGLCEQVDRTRARGGRVVAVGTTTVRALESAARAGRAGELRPFTGSTDLFILPGFRFRTVDALLTNFHLPGSTLLMLVAAFAGRGAVLDAYRHAVSERYRFASYGDAMYIAEGLELD